jgi:hypothetical protein
MNRKTGEQMAYDDVFFSIVIIGIGLYGSRLNWIESDWWGLTGTILMTGFGGLWLAARIYHLTHKDEVFGKE